MVLMCNHTRSMCEGRSSNGSAFLFVDDIDDILKELGYASANKYHQEALSLDTPKLEFQYQALGPVHFIRNLYKAAKSRHKKMWPSEEMIPFEELLPPSGKCPVLGIEFDYTADGVIGRDNKPTLDRVDNRRGYVSGNVRIISWRANSLKSNGTYEEFLALVEYTKPTIQ